jgi:hypothetical protein
MHGYPEPETKPIRGSGEPMATRRTAMKMGLGILLAAAALYAQAPSPQESAAALKESLAQNAAQLRTYSWIETTQVSMKGEVKKQEQKQCSYGADGKVVKTPIPGAAAPAAKADTGKSGGRRGGGRVKEKIVENKVEDIQEYMEKAVALVHQYVPPDAQKIQAAQSAGTFSAQPSGQSLVLKVQSYLKPGDDLAIGLDTAAKQLTSYTVHSFVETPKEDDVNLAVTFGKLADGTSYPQQIVLDVKAKQIQVKVTNSGYKKAS